MAQTVSDEAKGKSEPIQLTFIDRSAHCFDVDDYMKIRVEYRIPGRLVGCCPDYPQNDNLFGLPALYSPYELRLLVDKGYAVLVEKNFSQPPSEEIKQQYKNILAVNSVAIVEYARQNRMEESMKVIDKIIAGKRKKCTAKGLNPDEITVDSVIAEMRDNFKFNPDQMTIEVPMAEPFEVPTKVITELPHVDPLMYRVYLHYWESGHWVTMGEQFGADFMLYPGETLYFHASHLVHVLRDVRNNEIPLTELIIKGRMSIIVNKLCVFVFEHTETNELCFETLQWEGHEKHWLHNQQTIDE